MRGGGPAVWPRAIPIEQPLLSQPNEKRIQGTRLQPEFFGKVVSVSPLTGRGYQRCQQLSGLPESLRCRVTRKVYLCRTDWKGSSGNYCGGPTEAPRNIA